MSTAVIYFSKHGTTAKVAERIAAKLNDATLVNLQNTPCPDLAGFKKVVLGGPIYAGQPTKQIKTFITTNSDTIQSKVLALFVVGMESNSAKRDAEIAAAFPEALRSHAVGTWFTGGEFQFDKLGFIERAIVKRIVGITDSVSVIDDDAIAQLVTALI